MVKSTGFTVSFTQVAASDRAEEYDVYVVGKGEKSLFQHIFFNAKSQMRVERLYMKIKRPAIQMYSKLRPKSLQTI